MVMLGVVSKRLDKQIATLVYLLIQQMWNPVNPIEVLISLLKLPMLDTFGTGWQASFKSTLIMRSY